MWIALGVVFLAYLAWCSGEHHADRAKRIIENNRVERRKKWRDQERLIRSLQFEIKQLKNIIKRGKR